MERRTIHKASPGPVAGTPTRLRQLRQASNRTASATALCRSDRPRKVLVLGKGNQPYGAKYRRVHLDPGSAALSGNVGAARPNRLSLLPSPMDIAKPGLHIHRRES